MTRWPVDAGNQDWSYGVGRGYLQGLVDYWRTDYDWRKAEAAINAYEHYRVEVEGVPVHFMRRPSPGTIDPHARLAVEGLRTPAGQGAWPPTRPGSEPSTDLLRLGEGGVRLPASGTDRPEEGKPGVPRPV